MSYIVNKSNSLASPNQYVVEDNILNTQTDLSFVGKGYAGYGEIIAENFLHLLENFSSSTEPSKPIKGQLWFDESQGKLKVYAGTSFQPTGGANYQATAPANMLSGDLWINSSTQQLYFNNGTTNVLVGPPSSSDSGLKFDQILDATDATKNLQSLKSNGQTLATISDEEYTPKVDIAGFKSIKKGISLYGAAASSIGKTSTYKFYGSATNADSLGDYLANEYVLKTAGTTNVMDTNLTIAVNTGLSVGTNRDFAFIVGDDSVTGIVQNRQNNGDIIFRINDGGVTNTIMTIDGSESRIGIGTSTPSTKLDVLGTVKATAFSGSLTGSVSSSSVYVSAGGTISFEGASENVYKTTLTVQDPTSNNTITLPNRTGTVITSADTDTVNKDMLYNLQTLQILDSSGAVLKTIYGVGDAS